MDNAGGGVQESWVGIAQYELFTGWQRWASFSCIWVWSCLTSIVSMRSPFFEQLPACLSFANSFPLVFCVLGLVVVLAFSGRIASAIDSDLYINLAKALLVGGSVLIALGGALESFVLFAIGSSCGGAAIALLKVTWGEMFSRMTLRAGLASMGYALISSSVIATIVQQAPNSVLCLLVLLSALPCAAFAARGARKLPASNPTDAPSAAAPRVRFTPSLLILPLIVGFSSGVMISTIVPDVPGTAFGSDQVYVVANVIVGIIILVLSYHLGRTVNVSQVFCLTLVFLIISYLLVMSQTVPGAISYFFNTLGFELFYFFMIVYWGDLSKRTGISIARVYVTGYLSLQAMRLAGALLSTCLNLQMNANALLPVLWMTIGCFALVTMLLAGTRSSLRSWLVADEPALEVDDAVPQACDRLAAAGALSPREREILAILARGRNASFIARTLCISQDTAKTHIRSVYRKLDVHTQQELMDTIDAMLQQPPR